jgi:hypothetical protein
MPDFETIRDAKNDLVLSNQHFAVLFDSMLNPVPQTLESPSTGELVLPTTAQSAGIIEKSAGVALAQDITNTDIEGYGEADPVRSIISKRMVTFEANFLETNKVVLEKYWGTTFDSTNFAVSAQGGTTIEAPTLPKNVFYRAYLVGLDDVNGLDLYSYYILPKVKLTNVANQDNKDDGAVSYTMTFGAFRDAAAGFSLLQGWCGPGWRSLVHKTGFVAKPTSISAAAVTGLTATAGVNKTKQIVVTGNNGINYTPDCSFVSADPTKATVSATGLLTGIAVGSTTIAITYNGVSPSLTVSPALSITVAT